MRLSRIILLFLIGVFVAQIFYYISESDNENVTDYRRVSGFCNSLADKFYAAV